MSAAVLPAVATCHARRRREHVYVRLPFLHLPLLLRHLVVDAPVAHVLLGLHRPAGSAASANSSNNRASPFTTIDCWACKAAIVSESVPEDQEEIEKSGPGPPATTVVGEASSGGLSPGASINAKILQSPPKTYGTPR